MNLRVDTNGGGLSELLAALGLMEGDASPLPWWLDIDSKVRHSLGSVYHQWRALIRQHGGIEETLRHHNAESSEWETIYGRGGMHRYALRVDGSVWFSRRHASKAASERARSAGFQLI